MKRKLLSAFLFLMAVVNVQANNNEIVFKQNTCEEQFVKEFTVQPVISVMDDCQCPDYYLAKALNKAMENVREGSRIAIDQIRINLDDWCGNCTWSKGECKDQVIEILLDNGYKVVAKEYLEKLYDEQNSQQSGIYNEKTTVKTNNFSAVGYFLNVKISGGAIRIQVIDVSTGEYVANIVY